MPPVTVLIVGAGSRGRTVFGQFALHNPELCRVVAVADLDEARRGAMAQEHNIPAKFCYSDWREIDLSKKIADVAIVATDDLDHTEPALAFLKADYHLLLEKPMSPDLEDCLRIVEASKKTKRLSAICHVLRYTNYFRKLRELIAGGAVGTPITVRHLEPVNYWHFAHSFVRGNWRNSDSASPFILAKCCHDMDILLFLLGEKPTAVQSFGGLHHFQPGAAPPEATERCHTCPLKGSCAYSATRQYGDQLRANQHWWPLDVVTRDFTEEGLAKALKDGPYGRCVYHCDNNVPDHQVVNLQFASGATASLTATAFTEAPARQTEVMGSFGQLLGDGTLIRHTDFRTREVKEYQIEGGHHHLGGDEVMLEEFFQAVQSGNGESLSSTPEVSLLSHQMALLAERSRLENRVIII